MEYISDSYVILAILVFASFCAGFIDSIAGGGGFILVPALMLAGLPPQAAIATNKRGMMNRNIDMDRKRSLEGWRG